jgi:single-strand DNA-binding protein
MSKCLNRVTLIGNIGKPPDLRVTPGGQSVMNFSLATSEEWLDKKSNEKKSKTEWHRIVMWGKVADALFPILGAGKRLFIEGSLQTRQWEKDGQPRYTTEIQADRVILLSHDRDIEKDAAKEEAIAF